MFFSGGNSYYEKFADGTVKCIDEEIPFEIPQGWEWTRMKDVMTFVNGRAYKKEELLEKGKYRVLRVGNFFTNDAWYYSDLELPEDKYCDNGDLLYAWSASFGPQIWQGGKTIFHYHIWNIQYSQSNLNREYLYFFLEYDKTQIKKATTGSTMVHISMENMNLRLIPIPPFSEQRRIIDKLISILPIVRKYEMSQYTLDALNKSIKNRLRKAILQEAIQGHLVAQDCDDEPTSLLIDRVRIEKQKMLKEGKLKKNDIVDSVIFKGEDNKYYEKLGGEVTDISEQLPFDIPSSWAWCRLGFVIILQSGQDLVPERYFTIPNGIPYITGASNLENGAVIVNRWTNTPTSISHKGDLLITCKGTVGTMAYNTIGDIHIARQIMAIHSDWILIEYIEKYLEYSIPKLEKAAHSIIPGISRETILSTLIPIPPLGEQSRIIDRFRELNKNL